MQYTCSGCGKTRSESNHWFMLDSFETRRSSPGELFTVSKFSENIANGGDQILLCGQDCLVRCINFLLSPPVEASLEPVLLPRDVEEVAS
jgi:hypothetical protein